jgi:hypothetical protein
MAVRAADGVTAVSARTYEDVLDRVRVGHHVARAAIPLGWECDDVARMREAPPPNPYFDSNDGRTHLVYAGTVLPHGMAVVEALFEAVRILLASAPGLADQIRLHFFGTSNQSTSGAPARVAPLARRFGLETIVSETPERIHYLQTLRVLDDAGVVLLLGSTEPHYTASKLYPALLARRPILALFHHASTVAQILRRAGAGPSVRVVTYDALDGRPSIDVARLAGDIRDLVTLPPKATPVDFAAIEDVSARSLARKLGALLDEVCAPCA